MHGMQSQSREFNGKNCSQWRRVLLLFLLTISGLNAYHTTRVTTKFGDILGLWSRSTRGRLVAHYLGIPYAEPPIDDLRFRSPQPWNRTWTGTYNAIQNGNMCLQLDDQGNTIGSEDCLYLNIFVPILSEKREISAKLPVLVFVPGGSFHSGSGNSHDHPPDYLMDQNLILVTLNYRLGILGFFSTANKVSPGNYGLKDILMALRWLHENIEHFGGDPNSVTLWGHSAGASAVQALTLANKTEGLFHRYILQSGSILAPWGIHSKQRIREASLAAASALGCLPRRDTTEKDNELVNATVDQLLKELAENVTSRESNDTIDYEDYDEQDEEMMMRCMRSVEANRTGGLVHIYFWRTYPIITFGPTIEDESEDAILTMHPLRAMKNHQFRDIPCIIGNVEDEGLIYTIPFYKDMDMATEMTDNFETYLPYVLEYQDLISNTPGFIEAIEKFYFNGNITEIFMEDFTELMTDAFFTWPTYQALIYQLEAKKASTYLYMFSYQGTFSNTFHFGDSIHYGVTHADDYNYLIPLLNRKFSDRVLHNTENDVTMINIMTEMWASFATKGVPEAWLVVPWPDYKDFHEFLRIGHGRLPDISVDTGFLSARMAFWNVLTENITLEALNSDVIDQTPEKQRNSSTFNEQNTSLICLLILFGIYFL